MRAKLKLNARRQSERNNPKRGKRGMQLKKRALLSEKQLNWNRIQKQKQNHNRNTNSSSIRSCNRNAAG